MYTVMLLMFLYFLHILLDPYLYFFMCSIWCGLKCRTIRSLFLGVYYYGLVFCVKLFIENEGILLAETIA